MKLIAPVCIRECTVADYFMELFIFLFMVLGVLLLIGTISLMIYGFYHLIRGLFK